MILIVWCIWFVQTYLMAIIMLNFLVAFVSQAYEKVTGEHNYSQYESRCEMNL